MTFKCGFAVTLGVILSGCSLDSPQTVQRADKPAPVVAPAPAPVTARPATDVKSTWLEHLRAGDWNSKEVHLFEAVQGGVFASHESAAEIAYQRPKVLSDRQAKFLGAALKAPDFGTRLLLLSLMQHPDFLSETDREGRGLMHWLVAHDHVDSVRALIALGEKDGLLQTDSEGNYPSHLVRSSAMLNALWNENFESLDAHHEKLLTPVYELRNKDGRTPLHLLAQQGNADAVSTYVDRVCPEPSNLAGRIYDSLTYNALDLRDRFQRSALHYAAISGNADTIQKLASCRSVDVNAADLFRRSPLHYAFAHKDFAPGQALNKGAASRFSTLQFNGQDVHGDTPLHIATRCHNLDGQRFAIAAGAKMDTLNVDKQMPLDPSLESETCDALSF